MNLQVRADCATVQHFPLENVSLWRPGPRGVPSCLTLSLLREPEAVTGWPESSQDVPVSVPSVRVTGIQLCPVFHMSAWIQTQDLTLAY